MSTTYEKTQHFAEQRSKRENFILNTVGLGEDLDEFLALDKKYNSPVLHIITTTGVYKIMTPDKEKLITMWIARPQQLKDLYKKNHAELPKWLLQKAIDDKQMGYCWIGENNPHTHYNPKSAQEQIRNNVKPDRRKHKVIY